ncbi:MAG TPA: hypothetical protein VF635_14905 [Propionibacteriaceae bacterium]
MSSPQRRLVTRKVGFAVAAVKTDGSGRTGPGIGDMRRRLGQGFRRDEAIAVVGVM